MMNDLINTVSEKTGLSPDQSQAAVGAVIGLFKERLPSRLADVLTSLVHGGESRAAAVGAEGSGESGGAALAGARKRCSGTCSVRRKNQIKSDHGDKLNEKDTDDTDARHRFGGPDVFRKRGWISNTRGERFESHEICNTHDYSAFRKDIADAKTKGFVWVNTSTKVSQGRAVLRKNQTGAVYE
jgi:hypothetical protein